MRLSFILPLVLGLTASSALAQSIDISGDLSVGVSAATDTHGIARVDLTFALPITERLAFEAGTFMTVVEAKRPHETYAALVWDDALRVGAVRPAYDAVIPSVFAALAPDLAYERAEITRALTTVKAMRATAVPWGLSYQGQSGAVDWAISAHDADKGGFRSLSASMAWTSGSWVTTAAAEHVEGRGGQPLGLNAKLGVSYASGPVAVSLSYLHPQANDRPDAVAADLSVKATDVLRLHAFGEVATGGGRDAFGLGFAYQARPGRVLYASGTRDGDETGAHVGLRFGF